MGSGVTLKIQSVVKNESSPLSFSTKLIDAASIAQFLTDWAAFIVLTDAITVGVIAKETVKAVETKISGSLPVLQWARRELKMLVTYIGDTSGKLFSCSLPCPDLTTLQLETGDANFVVLADGGAMAAWITAWEGLARSPDDETETVTIMSAEIVGRNI